MKRKIARIYCDACTERTGVGIGIYCKDPPILISQKIKRPESNNAAECITAIKALEEAEHLGLRGIRLYSDSELVVYWTNGHYMMRSYTALKYVPNIQELLKRVEGTIRWIPGSENPADKPSREAIGAWVDGVAPWERLSFGDLARLKCGRDEFSKLRLPKLETMVNQEVLKQVTTVFTESKHVATCLRWVLRGLCLGNAISKVRTDLEIGENARQAKLRARYWA